MVEAVAQAANIPLFRESHEPFSPPLKRLSALIVGGTHLIEFSKLFPRYAVTGHVLVPSQLPEVEAEIEMRRALQLESMTNNLCVGGGLIRDLSGVDTDSVDVLIVCTLYPSIRDEFLSQAWRVVREFGRVLVFTNTELPLTHLASFGIAAPKYFPAEGFYAGVMRKVAAIRARN